MGHSKDFPNLTIVTNVLISSGKYLKKYEKKKIYFFYTPTHTRTHTHTRARARTKGLILIFTGKYIHLEKHKIMEKSRNKF